jgi:membrane protease YdiL (CAAX protease family)
MTRLMQDTPRPRSTRRQDRPRAASAGFAAALQRRPVTAWAAYLAVLAVVALAVTAVWPELTAGADGLSMRQVLIQALLTLLPLPAAAALGWHVVGLRRPRNLRLAAFPAATVAFGYLAPVEPQPLSMAALAVLLVLLVAVGEEIAFRGVLLHLLAPRGVAAAVTLSSLLFGLTHAVNLLMGAPAAGVALQVFFAGAGAAGFAALRIRTDLAFRVMDVDPSTWHGRLYYTLHGIGLLTFAVAVLRRPSRSRRTTDLPAAADCQS